MKQRRATVADDDDENERRPRLPPELLEQIISHLALPCTYGDPIAARTLAACSLVSRAMRFWALRARFNVVVSPRHVRDFRRWYARSQRDMQGSTHALFVALDDVSKLTSMSAGWDALLLKLLQQQGPHLTQLSLWTSESRVLLRDPAQIRGPRVRHGMMGGPSLSSNATVNGVISLADVMRDNAKRRRNMARLIRRMRQGRFVQGEALSAIPLKADFGQRDEAQTRAEMTAAKERARQTLPNWLRHELDAAAEAAVDHSKAAQDIKRRYKAHIAADAREYQHEREAGQAARRQLTERERAALDALQQRQHSGAIADGVDGESDEDDGEEVQLDWTCMPKKLSICPSLPLHEHEEPLNFARMSIWSRVEELDMFVAVPSEVSRCLDLLASLVASPLVRLRFSSLYASLLITLSPSAVATYMRKPHHTAFYQPDVNLAGGLRAVLDSEVLRSLLLGEFHDHRVPDVGMVERAIAATMSRVTCESVANSRLSVPGNVTDALQSQNCIQSPSLADSLSISSSPHGGRQDLVCVRILQGDQGHYGKLKDRRQDFLVRALRTAPDCWTLHCS